MNAKENWMEAVHFGAPERVPLGNEPIWHSFELEGNFHQGSWTDRWGVRWEVGRLSVSTSPTDVLGTNRPCSRFQDTLPRFSRIHSLT